MGHPQKLQKQKRRLMVSGGGGGVGEEFVDGSEDEVGAGTLDVVAGADGDDVGAISGEVSEVILEFYPGVAELAGDFGREAAVFFVVGILREDNERRIAEIAGGEDLSGTGIDGCEFAFDGIGGGVAAFAIGDFRCGGPESGWRGGRESAADSEETRKPEEDDVGQNFEKQKLLAGGFHHGGREEIELIGVGGVDESDAGDFVAMMAGEDADVVAGE